MKLSDQLAAAKEELAAAVVENEELTTKLEAAAAVAEELESSKTELEAANQRATGLEAEKGTLAGALDEMTTKAKNLEEEKAAQAEELAKLKGTLDLSTAHKDISEGHDANAAGAIEGADEAADGDKPSLYERYTALPMGAERRKFYLEHESEWGPEMARIAREGK